MNKYDARITPTRDNRILQENINSLKKQINDMQKGQQKTKVFPSIIYDYDTWEDMNLNGDIKYQRIPLDVKKQLQESNWANGAFSYWRQLESAEFSNLDNIISMNDFLHRAGKCLRIVIPELPNVISMKNAFLGVGYNLDSGVEYVNPVEFVLPEEIPNVVDIRGLFESTSPKGEVFNFPRCPNAKYINGCLTAVGPGSIYGKGEYYEYDNCKFVKMPSMPSVEHLYFVGGECRFETIEFEGFPNTKIVDYLFSDTNNIKNVTIKNLDSCEDITLCFDACPGLETVNFPDLPNIKTMNRVFDTDEIGSIKNLTIGKIGENITNLNTLSLHLHPQLTVESILNLFNALPKTTTPKQVQLGSTNINKLSNEQKAIAINKGWTLI